MSRGVDASQPPGILLLRSLSRASPRYRHLDEARGAPRDRRPLPEADRIENDALPPPQPVPGLRAGGRRTPRRGVALAKVPPPMLGPSCRVG